MRHRSPRLSPNIGAVPEAAAEPDDTEPNLFGASPEQEATTVPRCFFCGSNLDQDDFEQGVKHALRGLYWSLQKRMDKKQAAELTVWLQGQLLTKP